MQIVEILGMYKRQDVASVPRLPFFPTYIESSFQCHCLRAWFPRFYRLRPFVTSYRLWISLGLAFFSNDRIPTAFCSFEANFPFICVMLNFVLT